MTYHRLKPPSPSAVDEGRTLRSVRSRHLTEFSGCGERGRPFGGLGEFFRWFLPLVALCGVLGCSPCVIEPELFDRVAKARGVAQVRAVPCEKLSTPQIHRELATLFTAKADPKRIYWEGATFRTLKLIPEDFRYPDNVIEFYSERLLALYEPEGKRILLGNGRNGKRSTADTSLLAHEITHALQDQQYDVNSILDYSLSNDEMMARSALLEGDANVTARLVGGQLRCNIPSKMELYHHIASIKESAERFPPALEMMTAFPYLFGERFVCELRRVGGAAQLERAYRILPLTSREIAFPERYLSRIESGSVSRSDMPTVGPSSLHQDTLGQFILFALLLEGAPVEEAARLSESWRDDRLEIRVGERGSHPRLTWRISTDSADNAAKIVAVLRGFLSRAEVGQESQGVVVSATVNERVPDTYQW